MPNTNLVRPFRALHYNPQILSSIGLCFSQPYDVISPAEQDEYYRQHQNNVIRLILNKKTPDDNAENNCYTRADGFLKQWLAQKILIQSDKPAFWIYERQYECPSAGLLKSKGFIGAVSLTDFDQGLIIPHERTMKKFVNDRMKLVQATQTQLEYIWGFFQDQNTDIEKVLNHSIHDIPLFDFIEKPNHVRHKLWPLTRTEDCRIITERMKGLKLFIADGHHRYTTMLNLSKIHNIRNNPDNPWNYILMFLQDSDQEELTVLPYHRIIESTKDASWPKIHEKLAQFFDIKTIPFLEKNETELRRQFLAQIPEYKAGQNQFGLVLNNQYIILNLREKEKYRRLLPAEMTEDNFNLDVSVLNNLILNHILGFSDQDIRDKTGLDYSHDSDIVFNKVQNREAEMGFILNPTPLEKVIQISLKGEVMPQKSTFFYPKLVSGLVFYPMRDNPF